MEFLKQHRAALISSFILALLIEFPLVAFYFKAGDSYQGINIAHFGTDEHLYLTRGNDVLHGNYLGNPALKEGKSTKQDYYFTINEYVLVGPLYFLGLKDQINIVTLYNIYNFIGVFLLILLIYFLTLKISANKFLAISAALFVVGGYSIVYNKTFFYEDFNVYGRSLYPYIGSLAFFSYLLALVKALKSEKIKTIFFAGALYGLLFYVYFYAWTFALVLNGILFLALLFWKDFRNAKRVFWINILGFFIGSLYLLRIFNFLNSPAGEQFYYFSWSSLGSAPIMNNLGLLSLVLFCFFIYKDREDSNAPFVLSVALAGFVALNQQIITGRMLQQNHYYWFFIVPLFIITTFYMLWKLSENYNFLRKISFGLLILLALLNTAIGQYRSFGTTYESKLYDQKYKSVLEILNKEKESEVVLAGDDPYAQLVNIYTPHDLFWHNFAAMNYNPMQRFKDALYLYVYLNKNTRNDFINNAPTHAVYEGIEGYLSGFDHYEYYRRLGRKDPELLEKREKLLNDFSEEYNKLARSPKNIVEMLKKYEVRYILWDENIYSSWDLSFINTLHEIKSENNIHLYEI
ncbi:hypothetical protein HYS99_00270 [Candidatus Giovannonibacteria bacterium]|nr:hypothetical protein [Candidatus Giovannonibacteria bacterium]